MAVVQMRFEPTSFCFQSPISFLPSPHFLLNLWGAPGSTGFLLVLQVSNAESQRLNALSKALPLAGGQIYAQPQTPCFLLPRDPSPLWDMDAFLS